MTIAWAAFITCSVLGAATFFAAGMVLTRGRAAAAVASHPAVHELARLRAEHDLVLADQRRLGDEVARLTAAARTAAATREIRIAPPPPPPHDPEVDVLRRRLADADELRAENARMRRAADDAVRLSARVTQLELELAEAVRRSAASQTSLVVGPTPAPATLAASLASGGLDALVHQLSSDPRFAAAVVSDELGLLVAGGGERAEELAALGGYLAGVADRASQLADLGAPTRIVVEDDRNTTLAAVHLPGGSLMAITISRRARPAARLSTIERSVRR